MKKISALILAVFLLCLSVLSVSANEERVHIVDNADVLTQSEESELDSLLAEISEKHEYDVVVVTVDSVGSKTMGSYASSYFKSNGYGMGDDGSGTILLVSMTEREWYIDYFGEEILPYADEMAEYFVSDLSFGDYYEAFVSFANAVDEEIETARTFPFFKNLLFSLVIAFVIAFIVTSAMKKQLKSVEKQTYAREYVRAGSFRLNHSRDLFLYSTVNRVRKPENNSSHGGGRSGGGNSSRGGGGRF